MVVAYVRLWSSLQPRARPASRIYALLLPSVDECEWDELQVQKSHYANRGVFPRSAGGAVDWQRLLFPIVVPYFGLETVTRDAITLRHLRAILRGDFQCVSVGEVVQQHGGIWVVEHDLYAVRCSLTGNQRAELALGAEVSLLQVDDKRGRCCYLLAEQAKVLLHLTGEHAHVFERLCERAQIESIHRHPNQHVETVQPSHLNPMSSSCTH